MKYNCHILVLQWHLMLVVLAPYHNHHYFITFFPPRDHTPCSSMHWVCSSPQHFLWTVTVTTINTSWVKLGILLSKHVVFIAFNATAQNIQTV